MIKIWKLSVLMLVVNTTSLGYAESRGVESAFADVPTEKERLHFNFPIYSKGLEYFYSDKSLPGNDYYSNPVVIGWYSGPTNVKSCDDYSKIASTFAYFPGVLLFYSIDLVNCKQLNQVLARPSQLKQYGQKESHENSIAAISCILQSYANFPSRLPEVHAIATSLFTDDNGKVYILNDNASDRGIKYDEGIG